MGLHTGWRRKSCKCCLQGDPTYSTVHSLHNTGLSRLTWCRHFGKTIFGQLHLENARDGRTDALLWCCLATSVKHGGKQSGENEKKQHIRHTDTNTQLKRWVYDGNNKTKLMRYWKKEQKKKVSSLKTDRGGTVLDCAYRKYISLSSSVAPWALSPWVKSTCHTFERHSRPDKGSSYGRSTERLVGKSRCPRLSLTTTLEWWDYSTTSAWLENAVKWNACCAFGVFITGSANALYIVCIYSIIQYEHYC